MTDELPEPDDPNLGDQDGPEDLSGALGAQVKPEVDSDNATGLIGIAADVGINQGNISN